MKLTEEKCIGTGRWKVHMMCKKMKHYGDITKINGAAVEPVRKQAKFTQYTFAEKVSISRNHYSQVETGDKNPCLQLALRIKNALGYHDDDMFFNSNRPKTGQS